MGAHPSTPSSAVAKSLREGFDEACAEAARLIGQADILLLCTGAGFSADSGLAIYADVAKVPPYKARDLEYHDICKPRWLDEESPLFWGFWGQCFNDYRVTPPHAGYEVIDRWADRFFRKSEIAARIRETMERTAQAPSADESAFMPYVVADQPGAFFVFTSNVDAHHFDWFRACEIRECHGNTELYQCSKRCTKAIWRAPLNFRFEIDQATMLAPNGPAKALDQHMSDQGPSTAAAAQDVAASSGEKLVPRIGNVLGGGRPTALRYMPGPPPTAAEAGFTSNHPTCPFCNGPSRPAILMFGDSGWEDFQAQQDRWDHWLDAAAEQISAAKTGAVRAVILEIGCGGNVTTVRHASEHVLEDFNDRGADVRLVRVNPVLPLGDADSLQPDGYLHSCVLSIMGGGLDSLRRIDQAMARRAAAGACGNIVNGAGTTGQVTMAGCEDGMSDVEATEGAT